MKLTAQLIALREETRGLTPVERAKRCCAVAKQLEKAGEYEEAYEALGEYWPDRDTRLRLNDLDEATKAEVLLRAGALSGWLGSTNQTEGSQDTAKNLITQSIEVFQRLGLSERLAEARGDLALCYWREGGYDEARAALVDALDSVGEKNNDLRALLLIRSGIVEKESQQLHEAMRFYNQAVPLLNRSEDHMLKGTFHNEYGLVFRRLAAPENREDYLDRALMEYTAAGFHFERARNVRFLSRVENNLGYLFFTTGKYDKAHKHLDRARHFFAMLKDSGMIAQVDDTRARTVLAEGLTTEAERIARYAVKMLEKGDEQAVLAEALTTQATALARLSEHPAAKRIFQRAIDVAQSAGDLEGAGRAKLSYIEELSGQTPPLELLSTYRSAAQLLKGSQDPTTKERLIACGLIVSEALRSVLAPHEDLLEGLEGKQFSWKAFKRNVRRAEKALIAQALRQTEGSVTNAAYLMGFQHHQSLISIINLRHQDLIPTRSVIRPRRQHLLSLPKIKRPRGRPRKRVTPIKILLAGDDAKIASRVREMLGAQDWKIETTADGANALKLVAKNASYDLLIVDRDLPGLSAWELILRIRGLRGRSRTPIIMLSKENCELEAFRAGVSAFVFKPQEMEEIPSKIARLLNLSLKDKPA